MKKRDGVVTLGAVIARFEPTPDVLAANLAKRLQRVVCGLAVEEDVDGLVALLVDLTAAMGAVGAAFLVFVDGHAKGMTPEFADRVVLRWTASLSTEEIRSVGRLTW
jgi:hypothetical protein